MSNHYDPTYPHSDAALYANAGDEAEPATRSPTIAGIVIEPGYPMTVRYLDNVKLEALQEAVGGWIEHVLTDDTVTLWVNEEGKMRDLQFNYWGNELWKLVDTQHHFSDWDTLVGPVVVTGYEDEDGETVGLPAFVVDWVREHTATLNKV